LADLSVGKLDEETYERLRSRASKHGVSMEEEVRRILKKTLSAPESISSIFEKHFGPENGVDLTLPVRKPWLILLLRFDLSPTDAP